MRNAEVLLSKIDEDPEVKWVDKNKNRIESNKFKTTY